MDKNSTNELTIVRLSIIDRIKNFFKKLFSKKEKVENVEVQENKKENTFINNVKIQADDEEKRLLKLQALIADDIVTEEELPEEDVKALHRLYDRQILQLKKEIDDYRERILKLRMNISE
ncbi:MAG: hypothetical protein HFJ42_02260 [Clostridia bacterium]|nr:hypothetical protein [Clostridia bacterium]